MLYEVSLANLPRVSYILGIALVPRMQCHMRCDRLCKKRYKLAFVNSEGSDKSMHLFRFLKMFTTRQKFPKCVDLDETADALTGLNLYTVCKGQIILFPKDRLL